jgi:hypothetical protein
MSTRGYIAIKENDKYKTIYHHWDSYPEYLGKLLLKHYSDINKVKEAISKGDASLWKRNINPPKNAIHNYENAYPDTSIFYHRDRKEDLNISYFHTKKSLIKNAYDCDIEYLYLFDIDINTWLVTEPYYDCNGEPSSFIRLQ